MRLDQAQQMSLLEGLLLKDEGVALAISNREELVEIVRLELIKTALKRELRQATADDMDEILTRLGCSHSDLGNAAGGIFKDGNWRWTRALKPSVRSSNHARLLYIWQLKSTGENNDVHDTHSHHADRVARSTTLD